MDANNQISRILAILALIVGAISLTGCRNDQPSASIVTEFKIEAYDNYVKFKGTIVGPNTISPKNTITGFCKKEDSRCVTGEVYVKEGNYVTEILMDEWDIKEWSRELIVAQYESSCTRNIIKLFPQSENITMRIGEPLEKPLYAECKSYPSTFPWDWKVGPDPALKSSTRSLPAEK